jgi:hypothetical protein
MYPKYNQNCIEGIYVGLIRLMQVIHFSNSQKSTEVEIVKMELSKWFCKCRKKARTFPVLVGIIDV